ncbi:DUF397 domain-containing protein [Saccharopolyspora sp. ASAGF58]|uniref:DUF397 domain-containing protein n=1 Tax=Saccharopolyspora sp. ASAGF58 TaxID=2719023 RepID=UPI0014402414|nr:DUF397 domain-containing protein [Saccharopolyspora sp. ASAGF58]QIZ35063.1 DUF397 domain-containing protein [Saccharopolyspora sp. ASAGF58]
MAPAPPLSPTRGRRKSSRSANNAHCVEVAVMTRAVGVRDTKDRDGGTLLFTPEQWTSFTTSLKQG